MNSHAVDLVVYAKSSNDDNGGDNGDNPCVRVDGSMQRLIELLKDSDVETQLEAAWCLNNIAGGTDDHAVAVLEIAGDSLIALLGSGDVPLEVCCHCS